MFCFYFDNVNMQSDVTDEKTGKVLIYKRIAANGYTEEEARGSDIKPEWTCYAKHKLGPGWM